MFKCLQHLFPILQMCIDILKQTYGAAQIMALLPAIYNSDECNGAIKYNSLFPIIVFHFLLQFYCNEPWQMQIHKSILTFATVSFPVHNGDFRPWFTLKIQLLLWIMNFNRICSYWFAKLVHHLAFQWHSSGITPLVLSARYMGSIDRLAETYRPNSCKILVECGPLKIRPMPPWY